jgi:hypothetical protein
MDRANQVTPVSKVFAAVIFVTLPFLGFWIGFNYQNELTSMYRQCMEVAESVNQTPAQ